MRSLALVAAGLVWALLAGTAPARAADADPDAPPADCSLPADQRPPDPRCGEPLDGRAPATPSTARSVTRGVLWVPRAISRALFWPVVETSDLVESHQLSDWLDAILTTDDGRVGVRPLLTYSTGFISTVGLRFFYRRLPGAGSAIGGRFQTSGSSVLVGELDLAGPSWSGLTLRALGNHRDDHLFAGIGPNSQDQLYAQGHGLARFGSDIWLAELRWSRRMPGGLSANLHGDVQRRDYRASGVKGGPSVATLFALPTAACAAGAPPSNACVDPALVPGFQSGLRIGHAGAALTWDLRRHARDGSGTSAFLDATVGQGLASDPSRHLLLTGETILAVGGTDRVLLLRGRAAMVHRLSSAPVPFEELVTPSGNTGMRGFPEGRFRGESGLVGTAEYRWYIAHNLDASLFSDVGTVAGPGFAGLGNSRWFPTFGVGLRLVRTPGPYWEGDLNTGVQLAYAPDGGFRLLLSVATF